MENYKHLKFGMQDIWKTVADILQRPEKYLLYTEGYKQYAIPFHKSEVFPSLKYLVKYSDNDKRLTDGVHCGDLFEYEFIAANFVPPSGIIPLISSESSIRYIGDKDSD